MGCVWDEEEEEEEEEEDEEGNNIQIQWVKQDKLIYCIS